MSQKEGGAMFHTKKGKLVEPPTPLAPLADTHGHLTSFRSLEPAQAIMRAAFAGVRLLVVPVDPADDVSDARAFLSWFDEVVAEAGRLLADSAAQGVVPPVIAGYEGLPPLTERVYFVAGVHPYGARAFLEDACVADRLKTLLDDDRCVGVGEFGLDYGPWNELPRDVQEEAFRVQLRLAHERELPVELHLRDGEDDVAAHDDALRVLGEEGVPEAGCDLHCYTGDVATMLPFTRLGCRVAFGGAVTFARSEAIREAAAACPEHLLLSETDCPYMAPVPLRGQECEPAMVSLSASTVADVREAKGLAPRGRTYAALWENALAFVNRG